jgi:hypothetical protein
MIAEWATQEMAGAALKDERRLKSLARICDGLAKHPDYSFSAACGPAVRQAAHRIFEHPDTTVEKLLAGHFQQTAQRCGNYPLILAIQDTTAAAYNTHRETIGLGPITDQATGHGLFAHSAYAVAPDGTPLGLLHLRCWARDPAEYGKTRARRQKRPEEKESHKWRLGLEGVERALPADQAVLLVQDREADVFDFLAAPRRPNTHLLIRASQARAVVVPAEAENASAEPRGTLFVLAASGPVVGMITVHLGRKPGRTERDAVLVVRCADLWVQPPNRFGVPQVAQRLSVILATELEPPAGEAAIEWVLLATLPCADGAAACPLVHYYARRWTIERLHYTLKTGLGVERLQIDDAPSLMHALALHYVVAWRLMYLTHLARTDPERPAGELLTPDEQAVLEKAIGKPLPTAREAVRAIAKLGGFEAYRNAPEPGVKVVWQGLRRLQAMAEGWRLAYAELFPSQHEL